MRGRLTDRLISQPGRHFDSEQRKAQPEDTSLCDFVTKRNYDLLLKIKFLALGPGLVASPSVLPHEFLQNPKQAYGRGPPLALALMY